MARKLWGWLSITCNSVHSNLGSAWVIHEYFLPSQGRCAGQERSRAQGAARLPQAHIFVPPGGSAHCGEFYRELFKITLR